ncbi:MAG: RIP metalloprotease RseP [Candidatus Cloacimonetes bacterium]|nr:RIP metalloprotease RseP [Candidatus Cloacimonadota bacterium]
MINLLLMIIALGLMITIHELGHFLVARAFGVGIEKFSIGFGRAVAEFERKGIQYRLAWIPLGGYVKMKGENPDENDSEVIGGSFQQQAWWKKALIAFSGPFANLIFGFILFVFAFLLPQKTEDWAPVIYQAEGRWAEVFNPADSIVAVNGKDIKGFNEFLVALSNKQQNTILVSRNGNTQELQIQSGEVDSLQHSLLPKSTTTIGEVYTSMPAWRAGLKTNDQILEVDSVAVADWYAMRDKITGSPNKQVQLKIQRGSQMLIRSIALEKSVIMGEQKMIGISQFLPVKGVKTFTARESVVYGAKSTVSFIIMNYVGLYKLIGRPEELKNSMGGPVMMATISQQAGQKGFSSLISFFAVISLILMIMNLLPIPVLDGGHIMFAILEGLFRRPVPAKIQAFLQRIGFALLMLLFVYAFYSDISKLILRLISNAQ